MKKIVVDEKFDGKSLNQFLSFSFPNLKQNMFFKALRKKDIRINGKRIRENVAVRAGDTIEVYISDNYLIDKEVTSETNSKIIQENNFSDLKIVYEDDNILVINKPAGISVTEEQDSESTYMAKLVKEKFGDSLEPCHRLDRNTKGLVLFVKNKEAGKILLDKFRNREIEKHYKALVYGIPKENHKVLKDYLFKDSKKSLVYISDVPRNYYQEIITEYTIIDKDEQSNTAELDVNLHTGRTHQIRAHLAFYGFPIIGDGKYGNNEINKKFGKKTQELTSYKLIFKFRTDSGILNYLRGFEVSI